MAKSKQKTKKSLRKERILPILVIAGITIGLGYVAYSSMIPVNAEFLVFGAPTNIYVKTISTPDGSVFTSQSVKGGKNGGPPNGIHYPTYTVAKGNLVSIHFINEDRGITNLDHQHDFNIDEFNVHSKILDHFQAQTITFVADKRGTFDYYCSIHPEMKGSIIVQ